MCSELLIEEIAAGEGESLSRAARRLPSSRRSRPVTISCLVRWVTAGVRLPSGDRVRLEAARCSGRWLTTPGAIRRFLAAQTPDLTAALPAPRSPSKRERDQARAKAQLATKGF